MTLHNRIIFIVTIVLATTLVSPAAEAWWNSDWSYRKRLDLDTTAAGLPMSSAILDVPVAIRLHTGNFPYFVDVQPDGADLRFVAADDTTPLSFHIEQFEASEGLGTIWVRLPRLEPASDEQFIWMYYGNPDAQPAGDAPATFDVDQRLVMHFSERSGLPQDSTAFGHDAEHSSVSLGSAGLLDSGIELDGRQVVDLGDRPALALGETTALSFSAWVFPKGTAAGTIYRQGTESNGFTIGVDATLAPEFRLYSDEQPQVVTATKRLLPDQWQYLAVTWSDELIIYIGEEEVVRAELPIGDIDGTAQIGANQAGYVGLIDELEISHDVRSNEWIRFAALSTSPDTKLIVYGADESESTGEGIAEYFGLFWALLGSVRAEGWIIIAIIAVVGLMSADVVINKSMLLRRVEKADARFLEQFTARFKRLGADAQSHTELNPDNDDASLLRRLFDTAVDDLQPLMQGAPQADGNDQGISPQGLEMLRADLDAHIVEATNSLNERMVIMTMAVSGGPFLGLLGTVMGVMITFASIAAAGDVNVNTIAPGVSAALATTVMGLLVAIPSLFAYNHLASRIGQRTMAMEVFADQLVSRLAMMHTTVRRQGDRDAA